MQIQKPTTIEQAVRLVLHYVGIVKLTKGNIKKVYKRSKQLQVLMNGGGFWEDRMPYLKEMEDHIGYVADVSIIHSDKKWDKVLLNELSSIADQWCKQEEEHLFEEDGKEAGKEEDSNEDYKDTITEANDKASIQLEGLVEETEKYPY